MSDLALSETTRLRFALEHLSVDEATAFERFCHAFFAAEFDQLRPLGGMGDKGRDAVLFATEAPGVVLQYSVAADWKAKIRGTLQRLHEAEIPCTLLIYATNQAIGTRSDELKAQLRRQGVSLDIRDREEFIARIDRSEATRRAAAELSARVIDPLQVTQDLVRNSRIRQPELRAGLVYLELLLHDVEHDRNLTKLSAEALVLSTLDETSSAHRRTRADIVAEVQATLPDHDRDRIRQIVDGALARLRHRSRITYMGRDDSFALNHAEKQLISERAGELVAKKAQVRDALSQRLRE